MIDAHPNGPVPLIVNIGARAGKDLDADAVRRAFAAHGVAVDVHRVEGDAIAKTVRTALDGGARTVIAAGGDGTVNAVASELLEREDAVLGVLPVGTLNHFARDLGMPVELDEAAAVIAAGHARSVDVGEVDDALFLNNASLGLYPAMVVQREALQRTHGLGKWPALARAAWSVLRHPRSFSLELQVDGRTLHCRTPFVFVGNNPYVLEGPRAGQRNCLDAGRLCVHVLRTASPLALVGLALRALFGRLSESDELDQMSTTELVVQAHHPQVRLARDGEVAMAAAPVHFRVRPRALRVIAPPESATGDR
ncbi:diacylglycerol kinase family lipid kinase [Lysobacter sp. TY2-98]|uniref:diacylglycerol/lipid kinase family protein n=1 Tax=Lysobacter sp. TY2-98 TaxID=2290922 RepID=UPI000E204DAE|nr:diacylglycerol kinase family protein [Lysobacter sp. TY2-98]AXK73295.1 diacylglycerol kinase family lipid kinase [Lysobacter sp. TY2-98]